MFLVFITELRRKPSKHSEKKYRPRNVVSTYVMENSHIAFIKKWAEGDNSSSEMIIELKNVYKDDEKLFTTNRVLITDAIRDRKSVV